MHRPATTTTGGVRRRTRPLTPAPRPDRITTTRVGLRLPIGLAFDSWENAGVRIAGAVDSFAWCVGDWLVYGQRNYSGRYRQAVEVVGLDYQTLRNYASVARRIELHRRRGDLSFQHHAEVVSLPDDEQDVWLARAAESGWSRNQLRQHVRASRGRSPAEVKADPLMPRIPVASGQVERWRAAAARSSSVFEDWVMTALDQAADRQLRHDLDETPLTA